MTGLARLFADDTSLSYSSADKHQIELTLNEDLQKLTGWAKEWLIFFNPQKTEVMLISNVFNDNNFELIMDGTILKIVETHKHLGLHLSSNNKWDGSTQADANRLEQVQLNAARIVSRLPVFASLDSLYYETGWDKSFTEKNKQKTDPYVQNCK